MSTIKPVDTTTDGVKAVAIQDQTLTKDIIIRSVIALEGGYVNDPSDAGGETNYGITKATANSYRSALVSKYKWDGTMKNLTVDMAIYIYGIAYWDKLYLDKIGDVNILLADKLFDIGVNIGTSTAGLWLKQILNALNRRAKDYPDIDTTTGFVGAGTLSSINGFVKVRGSKPAMKALIRSLISFQNYHYIDISLKREANEDFTFGWLNRLDYHVDLYMNSLK